MSSPGLPERRLTKLLTPLLRHGILPVNWTSLGNRRDGTPQFSRTKNRINHGLPHPRSIPRRAARREETDSRAGALIRLGFLPGHLRDVRLGTDEPDRRVWRVSAAISALAIRRGI